MKQSNELVRYNQRVKWLLPLLKKHRFEFEDGFYKSLDIPKGKLLDAEMIPFDITFFSCILYLRSMYEYTFHFVAKQEKISMTKKGINSPKDILSDIKKQRQSSQVCILVEDLYSIFNDRYVFWNNYLKHGGMPYSFISGHKYLSVYCPIWKDDPKWSDAGYWNSCKDVDSEIQKLYDEYNKMVTSINLIIKVLNQKLNDNKFEKLNTEIEGSFDTSGAFIY